MSRLVLPARPWWLAAAGYMVVTLIFGSPLVDYDHLMEASYQGDARLLIWTLAWDAHALLTGVPLFDANMFYPAQQALTWTEHHIGLAIFALPVYAATGNPELAYWTVWLLSFPLNALAMHALAWRLTRDHRAATIAGLVYAFCFFRMLHGHGHLQLLWTWPLPLIPLALERWFAKPTARHTALVLMLVLLQALTSWYLAVFAGLLSLITAAVLVRGQGVTRAHMRHAGVALAVAAGVLGWFARPYFALRTPGVAEALESSADLAAYLLPPENTWLGQWLLAHTALTPRWIWGEQTLYAGSVAIALAVVGVWVLIRRRTVPCRLSSAVFITGAIALLLSWGPTGSALGPFDLLARLPGMSMLRAPARFALLVMLALAMLAAYGTAHLLKRQGGRGVALVALFAAAFLAESFLVEFPGGKPMPFPVPPVYHHLSSLPAGAVLSLPTYRGSPEGFREADYLLYSTVHWYPMANGFGRHEPLAHRDNLRVLVRFPAPEAIDRLRTLGIRYVVVHTARDTRLREAVAAAEHRPEIDMVGQFGDDYLYQVGERSTSAKYLPTR
jgi:hypothetical protein